MIRFALSFCVADVYVAARNPLMQASLPRFINAMKQNLLESVEAMPAEHDAFKLSASQRAFGEWIDHTVMLLHGSCSAVKAGSAPIAHHAKHSGDKFKADLRKALKEAAGYCDSVLWEMTDAQALTAVTVSGKPTRQ